MFQKFMGRIIAWFAASWLLLFAPAAFGQAGGNASQESSRTNPLAEEMQTLDGTFREVVSAVAVGDGARVHKALEAMYGTMEKTHEGVRAGTVKLAKNERRLKEFVRLDERFHDELEMLDKAAVARSSKRMLVLTKRLLSGCVQCHRVFKK